MHVNDYKGNGKRTTSVSNYHQAYGSRRAHTYVLRSQNRQRVAFQRHGYFGTSVVAACETAKQSIKENAPVVARNLAEIVKPLFGIIALYVLSILVAAIEVGWVL